MYISIILFVTVVCVVYYVTSRAHMVQLGSKIPGPTGYPLIGNALIFWGKPNDVFKRLHEISSDFRRLVSLWIGPKLVVALFDARDVEVILKATKVMEKADEYKFLRPWLGDSILLSTGNKFRTNKKIIMPTFHLQVLKNYVEIFNEHAKKLVTTLQTEIGKEQFDIQKYLYLTMLGELLETTLGVSHETLSNQGLIEYGQAVAQLCKIVHIRTYKFWLRFDMLFQFSNLKSQQDEALKIVHPLTEKVISRRKEELKRNRIQNNETGEEYVDTTLRKSVLIDMLLEAKTGDGRTLTDQEIKDEVLTIMFAGQDTTAVSIGFALSLLGIYNDVQDKVHAELDDIFGASDRSATYEDLQKMEYLERVIMETWRLYPPIPLIARQPTQDVELETCTLPKGCTIAIILMLVHRNPIFCQHPHRFNPDNFLPENVKERHPYSYLPFSAGQRTCVGAKYALLNIKVLLSTLLRNYIIRSKQLEKDFVLVAQTTLKRREGFLIGLEPRKNAPLLTSLDNNNILEKSMNPQISTEIKCENIL